MNPGSPLRPLLRWTSLVVAGALLAWLGAARMHQQNFVLFLAIVLGLAIGIVVVFVSTAEGTRAEGPERGATPNDAG